MSGEPSAKRPCTDENKNATMSQQQVLKYLLCTYDQVRKMQSRLMHPPTIYLRTASQLAEAQQSVLQAYMQSLQSGQVLCIVRLRLRCVGARQ